ncbi:60S ribosomal protein l7-a, putative [Theileria annulata]|uniref:60S ribosomal protein l7-a, putative n=1 Tax=Theileria annulata TaxID=5874 RepID=Q4UAQ1_THEAN|nr:60S ribosomal protein l7-a, putative [Theileria annulata]CAI76100.1 60S ribosomal protein l7-a, putative [Theileria annulata]|eukprot:XP_952726.1 60S ribosomal protein l7-a, putative [Theileria annulata]
MKGIDGDIKKPETILRGHRIDLKRRSEIAKQVRLLKLKKKSYRDKNAIVSLNTIFKKSKQLDLDLKRTKAQEKKPKVNPPKEYKLLFVVRNSRNVESQICKDILKTIGLTRINTGRFMSNSVSNLDLINKVLPFVYYGTPTLKHVKDLLHKRGTIYQHNKAEMISGNLIIEENFSNYGIYSIDELIETIYKGSTGSEDILLKLGPINLSNLNIYSRFHTIYLYNYNSLITDTLRITISMETRTLTTY